MTYDKRAQADEALRRRNERDRLGHLERQAAARLKPFDWSDEHLGIRRKDVADDKAVDEQSFQSWKRTRMRCIHGDYDFTEPASSVGEIVRLLSHVTG